MKLNKSAKAMVLVLAGAAIVAVPVIGQARGMGDRMGMSGPMGGHDAGFGPDMMFGMVDADKDGNVTQEEFDSFRASRVTGIDANSDGLISVEELTAHNLKMMEAVAADRATKLIERQDVNGDGMLSVEEMLAPPLPQDLFTRLDADGDGTVTTAEFDAAKAKFMERARPQMRGHGKGPDHGPDHGAAGGPEGGMPPPEAPAN